MAVAPLLPAPSTGPKPKPRSGGGVSYLLLLTLSLLGLLLFGSLLSLEAPLDAAAGGGGLASPLVRLRSWAGGALGMAPADGVATALLFRAQGAAIDTLSGSEAAELLLAAVLASAGNLDGREALKRSAPLVRALASGGALAPPGTCHCLPALFVLATCRHWGAFDAAARRGLEGLVEDTVRHLEARVGRRGAFDARGVGSGHHAEALGPRPLLVASLAQVQAMAALRCAGALLLPTLAEGGGKELSAEALVAAERLRRGLADLHLPSDEAGEEGPYDVGSALPSTAAGAAELAQGGNGTGLLDSGALRRVRKLTSQLPMMLLFLEDGDVSAATVAAVATASLRLASPAGLSLWAASTPQSQQQQQQPPLAWRVSPQEQALIVAGAL